MNNQDRGKRRAALYAQGLPAASVSPPRRFRRLVWEVTDGRCVYCGQVTPDSERHVDHVVPIIRGGVNRPPNLVAACRTCNLSKRDHTIPEWRQKIEQRTGQPHLFAFETWGGEG